MNGFALDSNIISFDLKDNETVKRNIDQRVDANIKVLVPPFAYYEVKRGLVASKATRRLRSFNDLLKRCPLGGTNDAVFEAAVNIHADLKTKGRICNDGGRLRRPQTSSLPPFVKPMASRSLPSTPNTSRTSPAWHWPTGQWYKTSSGRFMDQLL
jgi:predicted nucleic acid-binding protein